MTLTAAPAHTQGARPGRRKLGRPRLLIVGCGDVGLRIVARLRTRFRILGTATSPASAAGIRAAGAVPLLLDLDQRAPPRHNARLARIGVLAPRVLVMAPTSPSGTRDVRMGRLLRLLPHREGARLVYISTTGVYGDRQGRWTDETTVPAPGNDRSRRRLHAERQLRASRWHGAVLRVPGIYAARRLPLERLRAGIPVPLPGEDGYTNHIHADDLARACIAALHRAAPARVYNTTDDTQLLLGQYLDLLADSAQLPRPPRADRPTLRAAAGPQRMAFMDESRRVRNTRMKRELRLRLAYPDIQAGLAAIYASNRPSTDK